jgi:hypothetical protein
MTTDRTHLRLMASSLDPLPPPLKTTILPPTLSTVAWVAIAVVVGAALAVLAGCGGAAPPGASLPPEAPRGERAVVLVNRSPTTCYVEWCGESCRDLPSLGVGPRVARRGSR